MVDHFSSTIDESPFDDGLTYLFFTKARSTRIEERVSDSALRTKRRAKP